MAGRAGKCLSLGRPWPLALTLGLRSWEDGKRRVVPHFETGVSWVPFGRSPSVATIPKIKPLTSDSGIDNVRAMSACVVLSDQRVVSTFCQARDFSRSIGLGSSVLYRRVA